MYKEVEGLIHAIEPDEFPLKACPKRTITAEKFKEYHETIVEKQVKNNSYCECNLTFRQVKHRTIFKLTLGP